MENIDDYTGLTCDEDTPIGRVQTPGEFSDIDFEESDLGEAFDSDTSNLEYEKSSNGLQASIKEQVYRLNKELHLNIDLNDPKKRKQRFILYMKLINEGGRYKEFSTLAAEYELLSVGYYIANRRFGSIINKIDRDDLEMELVLCIIENLPKYNPDLGEPSTFFCTKLFDRIFIYINKVMYNRSERDARRIYQVARILSDFHRRGITPSIGDISMELDLRYNIDEKISPDRIAYYVSRAMRPSQLSMDANDYLHEILPGTSENNIDFSDPVQIVLHQSVYESYINCIRKAARSEEDAQAFEEHYIHGVPVVRIAKDIFHDTRSQASIWRQFESIKRTLKKDPDFMSIYTGREWKDVPSDIPVTINTDEALVQFKEADFDPIISEDHD